MASSIRTLLFAVCCCLAAALGAPAAQAQYKVGDRVAADFGTGYLDSVIVRVDPNSPFPYRVHPLGYLNTMDTSFSAPMLKPAASVPTKPIGGIANDPELLKIQGKQAFHPVRVFRGGYECFALSGGRLEPRLALNFTIVDDQRYRDAAGTSGTYRFDTGKATLTFAGGALDGQKANYVQASDPPTKAQPPSIHLVVSGDACDRPIR